MRNLGLKHLSVPLSAVLSFLLVFPPEATAGRVIRKYPGFRATLECFPALSGSEVGFNVISQVPNNVNFFARELNFSYNTGFPSIRVGPASGSNNIYFEDIITSSQKSSVSVIGSVNAVSTDLRYLYLFVVPANSLSTTC